MHDHAGAGHHLQTSGAHAQSPVPGAASLAATVFEFSRTDEGVVLVNIPDVYARHDDNRRGQRRGVPLSNDAPNFASRCADGSEQDECDSCAREFYDLPTSGVHP